MLPIDNATLPRKGTASFMFDRGETASRGQHFHRGIDLPAKRGTPVRATAPGIVTHAVRVWRQGFTGYGRAVVLKHAGGAYTLHAHLQTVAVKVGQELAAGEVLGTVGSSRFSKDGGYVDENLGPHLHFEAAARPYPMASEAARLDPVQWLLGSDRGEQLIAAADASSGGAAAVAFVLGAAAWVALRGRSA